MSAFKNPDMKTIRKAILANRGGYKHCTDAHLAGLWSMLPSHLKQQYLESIQEEPKTKATKKATTKENDDADSK